MTRSNLIVSLGLMASSPLCFANFFAPVMQNTFQMYSEMSEQINDQSNQINQEAEHINKQVNQINALNKVNNK
ncbi:MAG: hypothetical protein O2809_05310 [Proteobacteria bacterium]|nr:hypothetical protein [Pseudomonadota bacterium]